MTMRVAIVGSGPTGLYTFQKLIQSAEPLSIYIFEKGDRAGIGMPYTSDANDRRMLANIASIEIPSLEQSYFDWLSTLPRAILRSYGVEPETFDVRTFTPRMLLGEYYRAQFVSLVARAEANGHSVFIHEGTEIEDVVPRGARARLATTVGPLKEEFDRVILATGHMFPIDDDPTDHYYPSPWSGLIDADIPASSVGIMGTSLSAIDAAMAVACQHGRFEQEADGSLSYSPKDPDTALQIALLSRSGVLPEADFYCPIPYQPLQVCTGDALKREVSTGEEGLLDRAFELFVAELKLSDPAWVRKMKLSELDADGFCDAYFAARLASDPFKWASQNLLEVERNREAKVTVAWRYAILRMHEEFEELYPELDEGDRERFDRGLKKVFVDNYAAVPPESIRRLLALRDAGLLQVAGIGSDYEMDVLADETVICAGDETYRFHVFIDARGQQSLGSKDIPFPTLRNMLVRTGSEIPEVGDDYSLVDPPELEGLISLGALPFLMHDRPFVQGITACAEIGAAMGHAVRQQSRRKRRRLAMA